jgi:hypothetical protein
MVATKIAYESVSRVRRERILSRPPQRIERRKKVSVVANHIPLSPTNSWTDLGPFLRIVNPDSRVGDLLGTFWKRLDSPNRKV